MHTEIFLQLSTWQLHIMLVDKFIQTILHACLNLYMSKHMLAGHIIIITINISVH